MYRKRFTFTPTMLNDGGASWAQVLLPTPPTGTAYTIFKFQFVWRPGTTPYTFSSPSSPMYVYTDGMGPPQWTAADVYPLLSSLIPMWLSTGDDSWGTPFDLSLFDGQPLNAGLYTYPIAPPGDGYLDLWIYYDIISTT
jgi:hypothetical protein